MDSGSICLPTPEGPRLRLRRTEGWAEAVGNGIKPAADDVHSMVIPGTGHWAAEQAPEEPLAALTAFLAPTATEDRSTGRRPP